MNIHGARRALHGNEPCGDAFAWWNQGAFWTVCLADGLGHGPQAAWAAETALLAARAHGTLSPQATIEAIDGASRPGRGVALALVQIDPARRSLSFAGVGNVRGALFGETVRRFEGTPGIVGGGYRSLAVETAAWRDFELLILWTDGFSPYLSLDQPSLRLKNDPKALAERLIEGASSGCDDAGVVCCLLEGDGG